MEKLKRSFQNLECLGRDIHQTATLHFKSKDFKNFCHEKLRRQLRKHKKVLMIKLGRCKSPVILMGKERSPVA
jgi:hypothetical protein